MINRVIISQHQDKSKLFSEKKLKIPSVGSFALSAGISTPQPPGSAAPFHHKVDLDFWLCTGGASTLSPSNHIPPHIGQGRWIGCRPAADLYRCLMVGHPQHFFTANFIRRIFTQILHDLTRIRSIPDAPSQVKRLRIQMHAVFFIQSNRTSTRNFALFL